MITRRKVLTAAGASALAAVGMDLGSPATAADGAKAPMSSTVFDWDAMKVETTNVGSVRHVCQAPTPTLDELECHITTLNAGQRSHAPHKHPDEELIVIKEGTVEVYYDGKTTRVGPGSVIFYSSNQMHGIANVGDGPATYHVFRWNSPGMLKKNRAQ